MFKRVILEDWHQFVPYICFALIGGVFAYGVWRALAMKKSDVDRISRLPLQSDSDLRAEATGENLKTSNETSRKDHE